MTQIYDRFGRPIKNLRIAVTERCNLACIYCHREGSYLYALYRCYRSDRSEELPLDAIEKIGVVAREFGIEAVKITGGEPLLREDILDVVRVFKELGFRDISMVTNGLLLEDKAYALREAGLNRINVSLPSIDPKRYSLVTRYGREDGVEKVIKGIQAAIDAGLKPVKINTVVLRGINDDEISSLMEIAASLGAMLQLIELQSPQGFSEEFFKKYFVPLLPIEKALEEKASKVIIRKDLHGRKILFFDNGLRVEIVRPMYNPEFCKRCTRIRVTAKGEWKPCLLREDNHVDFSKFLKNDNAIEEIRKAFLKAVANREPFFRNSQ